MFNSRSDRKQMKILKCLKSVIAISIVTILCVSTFAVQGNAADKKISEKISERLQTTLSNLELNYKDKIPVQIHLKDTIDYQKIEYKASNEAGITTEQIQTIESNNEIAMYSVNNVDNFDMQLIEKYEEYRELRIDEICKSATYINQSFLQKYNIKAESVSISLTDINLIYLSAKEIKEIANDSCVELIDSVSVYDTYTCGYSVSSADLCIRSNVSRNNGYDGTGIKVGVVEHGWANRDLVGSNLTNVDGPTSGTDDHATFVSGEIHTVVPGANIYLIKSAENNTIADIDALERLMTVEKVQVINMSLGFNSNGEYNDASRRLDRLVRQNKITVVVSAGNNKTYVSGYGVANNVITVGSVNHNGYTTATSNTYTFSSFSDYSEAIDVVNKPDVCAPGENLNIYGYTDWSGTSMSAPFVTGVVAQMIDRNSGLSDKTQTLKAALMASCYYNAGTDFTYNNISNKEGAGVIDADFTYRVARNGRRTYMDFTPDGEDTQTHLIYADYSNKDFRICIAWEAEIVDNSNKLTDYDLYIYKDDTLIESSKGLRNNEIVIIPASTMETYGAGYYTAKIVRYGTAKTSSDRIGLVWEQ